MILRQVGLSANCRKNSSWWPQAVESRFQYNVPQPCTVKIQILHNVFACQNPNYFRRKRSCGKVMLLHLSVSHSVHSGRDLPTPPVGRPGERGWADPRGCRPTVDADLPGICQQVGSTHPTGMHTCFGFTLFQLFTGRNEVVVKVMFLQVCVCPQGGRVSASVHAGMPDPPPDQAGRTRPAPPTRWTPPRPGRPPRTRENPPGSRLQHTVNEQLVRILLECILF